jgi:uncharacterized protein (TIGR02597 family)
MTAKTLHGLITLGILTLSCSITVEAQVFSEPVGFNRVTALGSSDTRFSVPFHRPALFQCAVHSVAGAVLTVQGEPLWASSQFLYAQGTQPNTYYVSFTSGSRAGRYYTVTANTAAVGNNTATITIDLNGDVIDDPEGVRPGDTFKVIPYWTLSTLFPGQQGISGATGAAGGGAATKLLFQNLTSAGINLPPIAVYFYYIGTGGFGPNWRQVGSGTALRNDTMHLPDSYMSIRQDLVPTHTFVVCGTVPKGTRKYLLGTLSPNTAQDIHMALDVPVEMTLLNSQLYQSGAFKGTDDIDGTTGDLIHFFDDSVATLNKVPAFTYFYYSGSAHGGPGWRQVSGDPDAIQNDAAVFQPGSGFIIRKQAEAVPTTKIWTVSPPYSNESE